MQKLFAERLLDAHQRSDIVILLAPRLLRFPGVIQKYDEPFLPFSRAVIQATGDIVAGYIFDMAAYLAIGAAGAIALERASALAPAASIKILHGPFATLDYRTAAFESNFAFDAVTVTDKELLDDYERAFVTCYTTDGTASTDVYWPNSGLMTASVNGGINFRVTSEELLYAAHGEDFAERLRDRILKMYNV